MSETYCLKQKSPLEIRRLGALALALAQDPAPPPAKQNRMVRREGMSRLKPKKHGDSKWDLIGDHRSLIGYTYLILSIYAPYIYILIYIYKNVLGTPTWCSVQNRRWLRIRGGDFHNSLGESLQN